MVELRRKLRGWNLTVLELCGWKLRVHTWTKVFSKVVHSYAVDVNSGGYFILLAVAKQSLTKRDHSGLRQCLQWYKNAPCSRSLKLVEFKFIATKKIEPNITVSYSFFFTSSFIFVLILLSLVILRARIIFRLGIKLFIGKAINILFTNTKLGNHLI